MTRSDYETLIQAAENYPAGYGYTWGYGPLQAPENIYSVVWNNPEKAREFGWPVVQLTAVRGFKKGLGFTLDEVASVFQKYSGGQRYLATLDVNPKAVAQVFREGMKAQYGV